MTTPTRGAPARATLAGEIVDWQRASGRHDLPWQGTRDPYRIWVSEIMLQQTRVGTVLRYFDRFVDRFPDVRALAAAPLDEVLRCWSGLGYYGRARNLHRCAAVLVSAHDGGFPRDPAVLATLPGIGESTAAAIAAFAWGTRAAILDGNVKRVFCRVFGVDGDPGSAAVGARLWAIARRELPDDAIEAYTQGLMDLGATICVRGRPACERCPLAARCVALAQGRTGELPTPRPARSVPVRRASLLLVTHGGDVLLERRPPTGVWGGLWSLPEPVPVAPPRAERAAAGDAAIADAAGLRDWLRARLGIVGAVPRPFGEVRHAFTHFRLHADVWMVELDAAAARAVREPGTCWLPLAEAPGAALPTPVRRLLGGLQPPAPPPPTAPRG